MPVQKGFFCQDNLIGSAANSPKKAATTVNTNILTGITGGNDSVMLHLDPVKTFMLIDLKKKLSKTLN